MLLNISEYLVPESLNQSGTGTRCKPPQVTIVEISKRLWNRPLTKICWSRNADTKTHTQLGRCVAMSVSRTIKQAPKYQFYKVIWYAVSLLSASNRVFFRRQRTGWFTDEQINVFNTIFPRVSFELHTEILHAQSPCFCIARLDLDPRDPVKKKRFRKVAEFKENACEVSRSYS